MSKKKITIGTTVPIVDGVRQEPRPFVWREGIYPAQYGRCAQPGCARNGLPAMPAVHWSPETGGICASEECLTRAGVEVIDLDAIIEEKAILEARRGAALDASDWEALAFLGKIEASSALRALDAGWSQFEEELAQWRLARAASTREGHGRDPLDIERVAVRVTPRGEPPRATFTSASHEADVKLGHAERALERARSAYRAHRTWENLLRGFDAAEKVAEARERYALACLAELAGVESDTCE